MDNDVQGERKAGMRLSSCVFIAVVFSLSSAVSHAREAGDDSRCHYIVFIVSNPNRDKNGLSIKKQKYAFICKNHAQTVAHELGHCLGLDHSCNSLPDYPPSNHDKHNLMDPYYAAERVKLRYAQWVKCHE